tara:strand:+ start:1022 stop:1273 length:252 start_codon:yes stop_codon:yes gene_type:complete
MFFKLQLLSLNIASAALLIFFLCLGSQNISKRHSLKFLLNETVPIPIGFLVGTSFTFGVISGGLTSVSILNNEINEKTNLKNN